MKKVSKIQVQEARTARREQRQAAEAERGYHLPLVLTCSVTGKKVSYSNPTYVEKVIARFGSLNRLVNNFVSRAGRKVIHEYALKHAKG